MNVGNPSCLVQVAASPCRTSYARIRTPGSASLASRHRALDAAYYEDLARRLYGQLIGLDDRLDREDARLLHHFIEVGKYGPALEGIAGTLAYAKTPITDQERSDMLALTRTMSMDDLAPRALEFCPRAA